jgi:hypothetical protein
MASSEKRCKLFEAVNVFLNMVCMSFIINQLYLLFFLTKKVTKKSRQKQILPGGRQGCFCHARAQVT